MQNKQTNKLNGLTEVNLQKSAFVSSASEFVMSHPLSLPLLVPFFAQFELPCNLLKIKFTYFLDKIC